VYDSRVEILNNLGLVNTTISDTQSNVSIIKTDVSSIKTDVSSIKTDLSSIKTDLPDVKLTIEKGNKELSKNILAVTSQSR
jgi:peptidoglycan hydrolase CwlO-like protein